MSSITKRVAKFLKNPTSCKYAEVAYVLEHSGFEAVPVKKSSHVKFKHPRLPQDLIIPVHDNDCKPFYKTQAKKWIQKLKE
jgi:predicted RNA binding protein YcfA (HicA-like mRNA interferase family)